MPPAERQPCPDELRALLPRSKFDTERVRALAAIGYPGIAPVLGDLMTWLQDINWPIATGVGNLLRTVGPPLLPEIERVFATDDFIWKRWVIRELVRHSPEFVAALRPELQRIANHPTPGELSEGLHEAAQEALEAHPPAAA